MTGIVAIAESHVSIHTWPEFSYAAADIFTCGNDLHPYRAAELIVQWLRCERPSNNRGRPGPSRVADRRRRLTLAPPMRTPPPGDWHYELITPDLYQAERIRKVYHSGRTEYQDVVVQDGAAFGLSLVLDGKTQSTEVDEFAYHEGLVHPAMIAHPGPRSVFVAGGGEGATIREALKHRTVERVVMVDIDKQVVELCRAHLPNHHAGSFDDPRVELFHADARAYLEATSERFDIVVIDVPDPLEAGPAVMLYTLEFYTMVRERLRDGGLIVAQSGPTGPSFLRAVLLGGRQHHRERVPNRRPLRDVRAQLRFDLGLRHRLSRPRSVPAVDRRG